MVFNSVIVVAVVHTSADIWQHVACIPERVGSHQLLDLICCFPLEQLGRLALCLWTFSCLPQPDSYYSYYSSDDDGSSSTVDLDDDCYHSHSN